MMSKVLVCANSQKAIVELLNGTGYCFNDKELNDTGYVVKKINAALNDEELFNELISNQYNRANEIILQNAEIEITNFTSN
jgi:hypothetical protein